MRQFYLLAAALMIAVLAVCLMGCERTAEADAVLAAPPPVGVTVSGFKKVRQAVKWESPPPVMNETNHHQTTYAIVTTYYQCDTHSTLEE